AVALSKAKEFGLDTVGCASTGNLANAVAAGAAAAGLRAVVLVPVDLEAAKLTATAVYGATLIGVRGNYDRVNRLCTEIADRFGWGLVNVNLRAYYSEGSKTVGFELAEQGGWELPRRVCVLSRRRGGLGALPPRRLPDGGGQPHQQGRSRVPSAHRARPRRGAAPFAPRRAGRGMCARRARLEGEPGPAAAGEALDDRA